MRSLSFDTFCRSVTNIRHQGLGIVEDLDVIVTHIANHFTTQPIAPEIINI